MTIKDRFLYFWSGWDKEYYEYDLTIFEMMIYAIFGSVAGFVIGVAVIATFPIWCVPYIVYKSKTIRKENEHDGE